jgi:hypothetical protein
LAFSSGRCDGYKGQDLPRTAQQTIKADKTHSPQNRREQEHKNHRKHDAAEITEQLLLCAQNKIFKHSNIPFYLMINARY